MPQHRINDSFCVRSSALTSRRLRVIPLTVVWNLTLNCSTSATLNILSERKMVPRSGLSNAQGAADTSVSLILTRLSAVAGSRLYCTIARCL